jgi:hypothetical protein
MLRPIRWVLVLALLAAPGGCVGDDDDFDDVGTPCSDSEDCTGRCVRGPGWPGGMCTYECGSDEDCPRGSACIAAEGGICAVTCENNDHCVELGFEATYDCRASDRRGADGEVHVCRG